jgi:hypothetical protein
MMSQVQSQTMTQVQTQVNSHIFPQAPSVVNIHPLPQGAEFFTYSLADFLTISAWMPNGFQSVHQEQKSSNDDFYHEHCDGCERNCYDFLHQYIDEDGDVVWCDVPGGAHCHVYEEGYYGQQCPEGHEPGPKEVNFEVSNMVFEISLSYRNEPSGRFVRYGDSAYLCAGKIEYRELYSTDILMASNVFGSEDYPEGICWGGNDAPQNLRSIVAGYFSTPFNNDLVSLDAFEDNCRDIRRYVRNAQYGREYDNHKFLCYGEDVDTLLCLDAEKNVTSFFTLLCAGFKPLEGAEHIMLIPAKEEVVFKNGGKYFGYQTIPDDVGKQWFVTQEGLLIGQI